MKTTLSARKGVVRLLGRLLLAIPIPLHAEDRPAEGKPAVPHAARPAASEVPAVSVQEPVTAEDQFRLGKSYATGDGVPKDRAEAVKWLRRAADQGLTEAAAMLAVLAAEVRLSDAPRQDKASQAPVGYEIRNIRAIPLKDSLFHAWSPDSRKIAVTIQDKGIHVINVADGAVKKLTTDGGGYRFCWSPDSREIVYLAKDFNQPRPAGPNNCIKVVDIETAKITALTDEEDDLSRPAFYKGGVIYSRRGTLVMHRGTAGKDLATKSYGPREVVAENVPANGIVPVPNGDGLIIQNDLGIEMMDDNAGHGRKPIAGGLGDPALGAMVSPRGDKILYHESAGPVGQVCVYDIASKKSTALAEGHFGQWLPDGRVIYYVMEDDGHSFTGSDIYIIDAAGASKLKIANPPGRIAMDPAVSPDGKSISFLDTKSGRVCFGELKAKNNKSPALSPALGKRHPAWPSCACSWSGVEACQTSVPTPPKTRHGGYSAAGEIEAPRSSPVAVIRTQAKP